MTIELKSEIVMNKIFQWKDIQAETRRKRAK